MTPHLHREIVPGCYRCDLNLDEEATGVGLTEAEATALAKRIIADHLNYADWLQWEDLPELGEHAFMTLSRAVDAEVERLYASSRNYDIATDIDSQWLKEQAS